MRVNGHGVKLVSFPVNVMFDFSSNSKYGICWNFDHAFECNRGKVNNRQSSPDHVNLM